MDSDDKTIAKVGAFIFGGVLSITSPIFLAYLLGGEIWAVIVGGTIGATLLLAATLQGRRTRTGDVNATQPKAKT